MHKINKPIALLALLTLASTAMAETIAHWHFDEGAPPNAATTLGSEYNPTIMGGTAASNDGGPVPSFSDDIGLTYITDGFTGTVVHTNKHSLKFTNTGLPNVESSKGGVITIPHDDIMTLSNLTVEVFVKMDRLVKYPLIIGKSRPGGDTTWNIDMNDTGKPRLRIDSYPIGGTKTQGDNWNKSATSSVGINDQRWHHIAFTYTHATKTARLYVDYKQTTSMTTPNPLVYEAYEMRIGQGCGGRAFDGWIDEVRISNQVLPVSKFMAAPRLGETYCYWNFDDGAAGTEANILTNSVYTNPYVDILHGVAGTTSGSGPGGVKPQFTNYLPSSTEMLVRDGVTGAIVNSNSTSLYFRNAGTGATPNFQTGSIVTAADHNIPEFFPTNFTVEAFVKADRAAQWALIIGKRRSNGGDYSWSIGVESDGDFRCRFDTTDPVTTTNHNPNQVFRSNQPIYDGSWHHVAMSYHYPTKTCKLYIDYELKRTATTTYPMYIDTGVIQIGGGDRNFDGWIDEMRITKRVLAPTEFLYLEKPPAPLGTVILIR